MGHAQERHLEHAFTRHPTRFLLELGAGLNQRQRLLYLPTLRRVKTGTVARVCQTPVNHARPKEKFVGLITAIMWPRPLPSRGPDGQQRSQSTANTNIGWRHLSWRHYRLLSARLPGASGSLRVQWLGPELQHLAIPLFKWIAGRLRTRPTGGRTKGSANAQFPWSCA